MKNFLTISRSSKPNPNALNIDESLKQYIIFFQKNTPNDKYDAAILHFENNFGAAILRRHGNYDYEENLFELAVLKFKPDSKDPYDCDFCYDTEITETTHAFNNEEINEILNRIKIL